MFAINSANQPTISIIVPSLNEKASLPSLYEKITEACSPHTASFEIIFVDDGSSDDSFSYLKDLHAKDPRVRAFRFNINYGKSAALAAGFAQSRGQYIVTIDADLQDDPKEIPSLIEKLKEGYDLVSGWKKERHDPIAKKLFSKVFNSVMTKMTGIYIHDFNCGLKAYRREVLDCIRLYGEMHRFIPVLAHGYGFKITEMPVSHHARKHGKSKYGYERIIRAIMDLITVMFFSHFKQRPSHFFGRFGLGLGAGSLLFFLGALGVYFWEATSYELWFPAFLVLGVLCLLGGLHCIFFGLIAEMLTYMNRINEPFYYINEQTD